jgi:glycosyltransferase involved in cell wall biosynthesis
VSARRRIAFLTPEFPGEGTRGGGLASYLARIAQALRDAGHEPEVFVLSAQAEGVRDHGEVRVERVRRADRHAAVRIARRLLPPLGLARFFPTLHIVAGALALSRALEARHRERPFDAVQSADYLATGLFVAHRRERAHLVRFSSASDLWAEADGDRRLVRSLEVWLERAASRRAGLVYAPSRWVAAHLSQRLAREVRVLRPPAFLEAKPLAQPPRPLPERFVLHLAKPTRVKGTPALAAALPRIWAQDPSFTLVYAGDPGAARLAGPADRVIALGSLEKPELYACLARAQALAHPSLVDNLPNAAIESLLLGVPVVAFTGASLDELIEPGVTGELAPMEDADALAAALLRIWRGESAARRGFTWSGPLAAEMRPDCAVANLLALAGLGGGA